MAVEGQTSNTFCILCTVEQRNVYTHVSDTYTGAHVNATNVQSLNCPINCPVRLLRPQLRSISRSLRINTSPPWEYTHPLCFCTVEQPIYIERSSVPSSSLKIFLDAARPSFHVSSSFSKFAAY